MPGQHQHTLESLVKEAREVAERGVAGVILFGIPEHKDATGSEAWNDSGIVQRGLAALKDELGDEFVVIADLCLCEYTDHGHCGIIENEDRRQRPDTRGLSQDRRVAGACRRRHRGSLRDDGRAGRRDPSRARRRRVRGYADPRVRNQVRVQLLRSLPRGSRRRAPVRGSSLLPTGPGQRRGVTPRGGC